MIKTIEVINKLDLIDREKYADMLKQVNIPDFYKCIAQFSGLRMNNISDETIANYLITWARNKYFIWKAFGDKTQVDMPISYLKNYDDNYQAWEDIIKEYPVFYFWCSELKKCKENRVLTRALSWSMINVLESYFPEARDGKISITHFFKKCLNAPDDLVTKIGRIYENNKIDATYTLSIDPTDMMLSSENPYDWDSCYRLELGRDDSHADGCMAQTLDKSSICTYLWSNHGKFKLYDSFEFKDIRYKRMRMTIAVSDTLEAIHFNRIYPNDRDEDFTKLLRDKVETLFANYLGKENKWKHTCFPSDYEIERKYPYGYSEYDSNRVYTLSSANDESAGTFYIFNEPIKCACGCGNILPGSYGEEEEWYNNGDGFIYENLYKRTWCSLADEYCDQADNICTGNCSDCWAWQNEHPVCEIDSSHECEDPDSYYIDEGVQSCNQEHCEECPFFELHRKEAEEKDLVSWIDKDECEEERPDDSTTPVTLHFTESTSLLTVDTSGDFVITAPNWIEDAARRVWKGGIN